MKGLRDGPLPDATAEEINRVGHRKESSNLRFGQ
jgi:hypothetical protein